MASKYDPLRRELARTPQDRVRYSFAEIEAILGFKLPASARSYAPWWANVGGSHVQASAWLAAGWRTCQVDVPGERVSFERSASMAAPASDAASHGVAENGLAFVPDETIAIDREALRGGALRLLEEHRLAHGGSLGAAAAALLNGLVVERRRQLLNWFRENSPRVAGDSTDIIREDRDAR